jgi:hypothetical protein
MREVVKRARQTALTIRPQNTQHSTLLAGCVSAIPAKGDVDQLRKELRLPGVRGLRWVQSSTPESNRAMSAACHRDRSHSKQEKKSPRLFEQSKKSPAPRSTPFLQLTRMKQYRRETLRKNRDGKHATTQQTQ